MSTKRLTALGGLALVLAAAGPAGASFAETTRVSVDSAGAQGNGPSAGGHGGSISADGRFVAFDSQASNLVLNDTNGRTDVFVKDRHTGETTRVSVSSAGVQGSDTSNNPAISADGRFVAFQSQASNLVGGDGNGGGTDVFVHDRQTGATFLVSTDSSGDQSVSPSFDPAISGDGRFVAFTSGDPSLVAGDTNASNDVFVKDRQSGETTRASVSGAGLQGNSSSVLSAISADGRFVAFTSSASNLVPDDTNFINDVFVHDRQTGATTRVSVSSAGLQGNSFSLLPAISADGRFVAFESQASNLVPGDANGNAKDVFVHDLGTGTTSLVSLSSAGVQGNQQSSASAISADGRFVAYASLATNLVPNDTNFASDVFVTDRQTGETTRVSVSSAGLQGNAGSILPAISADGRAVAFSSNASNLAADDTNAMVDVFANEASSSAPTAADDAYPVDEDATLDVAAPGVLANDDDADGDPLSAALVTGPTSGSLTLNADGSFSYTPNANFNGADSFTYRASDGSADSAPATVTLTVNAINDAPLATDDAFAGDEDATLIGDVLANDGDVDGDDLTAALVTGPAHGALALSGDGSFTYTPNANFNGADSFTYRANDGTADSGDATVALTVNAVDDAPVASADGPYLGIIGSPITFDGSASSDVEGSALLYTWSFGDGSTLVTTDPNPTHVYPAAGIYTVTLVVSDGSLDSAPATTSATIGDPSGGGRSDVDAFLSYAAPTERTIALPAGTTSFDVTIIYGATIVPATFEAELDGSPFAGFSPAPGTSQTVTIPLSPGRNVLAISVDGALPDGRTATDRDRLTFVVG